MQHTRSAITIGTNPIAWSNDDDPSLGGEISLDTCLTEASEIGFTGIEKGHKMPDDGEALRALLDRYHLCLVSGWHSLGLRRRSIKQEMAAMQPHLDMLKANGCGVCIVCETSDTVHPLAGVSLSRRPTMTPEEIIRLGRSIDAIADYCGEQGLLLAYHHHMGTVIQSRDEIARLMDATGDHTRLLLDTGHATFAGGDAVEILATYYSRLAHLHVKNLRRQVADTVLRDDLSFMEAVKQGVFSVPGDPEGCIDYQAVFALLAKHDYRGWVVTEAEQDPLVRNPREYQKLAYQTVQTLAQSHGIAVLDASPQSV